MTTPPSYTAAPGKYVNPFPPLALSPHDEAQLEAVAMGMVDGLIEQYEVYLQQDVRQVDEARWQFLKQREDVRVFKERRQPTPRKPRRHHHSVNHHTNRHMPSRTSQASYPSQSSDSETDEYVASDHAAELPMLLTVGTINGQLVDAMYGVTNPTLALMRIKTAYIQDGVINAAVLTTMRTATMDDPFRSLTIKWAIKGQPLHVRTLVQNRDLVYLEATGLTRLPSTGETVGYQVLHSVDFPQTHRLAGSQRGNVSITGLYRQHHDGVVDIFGKGFVDPRGRLTRSLVVKSAAEAMLSSWRTMYTAQLKKLAYAMRRWDSKGSAVYATIGARRRRQCANASSHQCGLCTKELSALAALTFGKKGFSSVCRLCFQIVCTSCRVKKMLAAVSQDGVLHQQELPICLTCLNDVAKANAYDMAVDELVHPLERMRTSAPSVSSASGSIATSDLDSIGNSLLSGRN